MNMHKTRIMVCDEQPFFRSGVAHALGNKQDYEVIECDPSDKPLERIEETMPEVVLLGSDLTSQNGLDLGRKIVRLFPNIRVIILSPDPNDAELFDVIRTAAVACVRKSSTPEQLLETIQRASRGEYPINESLLSPNIAQRVLKNFQELADDDDGLDVVTPLTQRERQILIRVTDGLTNKQIATELKISEQTIKNHVSAILRKLNANDRAHAAVLAIRRGYIPLGQDKGHEQAG
ncbi:MAG: response regulator transcription factor [Dehalogenimonas sp.]|uniref:Response regulator transcription factor n=1 Tax=Candidatus Dehalogenimonas loeffleri TaxID=3127115 RepID=A0ABZ2JBR1_9CHLR|nr:response regulator transcription factor [Dehalogenimonas sp.]